MPPTRWALFTLLGLAACAPDTTSAESDDEASTGSTDSEGSSEGDSESSGESSESASDTDESETGTGDPCEICSPDQLCVAQVDGDACGIDSGYTIECVEEPAPNCADFLCETACVESICGEDRVCVPECGANSVDVWCGGGPPGDCDPLAQDCPEGEKCVPFVEDGPNLDANRCVPILGEAAPGEACLLGQAGVDDCDGSGFCLANADQPGVCQAFCEPDATCPLGQACFIANEGVVVMCLPACDPEDPMSCPAGQSCVAGQGEPVCVFTGEPAQGLVCDQLPTCPVGYDCVAELPGCAGDACCTAFCELDDVRACASVDGLECVPFYDEGRAPPGFENLGLCLAP